MIMTCQKEQLLFLLIQDFTFLLIWDFTFMFLQDFTFTPFQNFNFTFLDSFSKLVKKNYWNNVLRNKKVKVLLFLLLNRFFLLSCGQKESKCTFFDPRGPHFHFPRTFLRNLIWLQTIGGFLQNFSPFISIHLGNASNYR